jgi:drug/metabolite transporter (DMT)-like permease
VSAGEALTQRRALGVALAVVVVWSASFTIQKHVYVALSAGGFLFARYLLLMACIVLLLCRRHGLHWPRLDGSEWRAMVCASVLGQLLHVGLVTYGIHWSTAFSSSLILACGPMFTLLILRIAGIERLGAGQVVGVAVACIGVVAFLSDKFLRADWSAGGGDLMLVCGALVFSLYNVQVKGLFERHGAELVMCYSTLLAVPPMLLLGASAAFSVDWMRVAPVIWVAFFWSVLVAAFFGFMLWGWVNTVRGVGRTAPLMYLMPPLAGVISWFEHGESFGPTKVAGAAIAIAGVAFAQFAGRRPGAAVGNPD